MNTDLMFSSKTAEWETPQAFFDRLNWKYHFTLDAAAQPENAKCERYFTPKDDGLAKNWGGQIVWCNPPYGREIGKWVKKGYEESKESVVVMLLPARTDTGWFHDYCTKGVITFLRGRLKFGNGKTPAPFPSMVVEFDRRDKA